MATTDRRETDSGIEIKPVYDAKDAPVGLEPPGEYPFTRGPYPDMYRGRPWTIRQYAGFASAEETNQRFRYLLDRGQTGLSVAFDLPTQLGYDSDDERAAGEVGRTGVAIDSIADMELLFAEIPLDQVSTSMTINAPAALLLLLYELVAEEQGVAPEQLRGTAQNDILKEYIARGNYIFPPQPSMRLTTDLFSYAHERLPKWNTISISGYHIREAGSTAIQAMSAVSGGAQSIHTNSFDEALALPTEHAARIALRTQQLLAHEAGGADTADPFGGSYFIEALTDELEAKAWELIQQIDELGGAVAAVEQGFVQGQIDEAAFRYSQEVESGERVIVGVNRYEEAEPEPIELHRLDPEAERRQLERTARVRAERDAKAAEVALAAVRETARGTQNLLPPLREALRARCTVGEICNVLRDEFGMYDAQR